MINRRNITWEPLGLIILAASLLRFPADSLRVMFQCLFEGGVVILLAYLLWDKSRVIAAFLLASLVMLWYPQYDKASYLAFNAVLYGCLWYWLVWRIKRVAFVYDCICLVALANVALLVLQWFRVDPLYTPIADSIRCSGFMSNPNETGALLALCLPAFLRGKWLRLIPVVLVGLVITKSTGGAMAAGAVLVWYLAHIKRPVLAGLVFGAGLAFALTDDLSAGTRVSAWLVGLSGFIENPMGAGLGHWASVFSGVPLPSGERMIQAHNEYVQFIFEYGIIGVVLLTYFGWSVAKRIRSAKIIPTLGVVSLAVNSTVNFPLHIATTAMIGVFWIAMFDKEAI